MSLHRENNEVPCPTFHLCLLFGFADVSICGEADHRDGLHSPLIPHSTLLNLSCSLSLPLSHTHANTDGLWPVICPQLYKVLVNWQKQRVREAKVKSRLTACPSPKGLQRCLGQNEKTKNVSEFLCFTEEIQSWYRWYSSLLTASATVNHPLVTPLFHVAPQLIHSYNSWAKFSLTSFQIIYTYSAIHFVP